MAGLYPEEKKYQVFENSRLIEAEKMVLWAYGISPVFIFRLISRMMDPPGSSVASTAVPREMQYRPNWHHSTYMDCGRSRYDRVLF